MGMATAREITYRCRNGASAPNPLCIIQVCFQEFTPAKPQRLEADRSEICTDTDLFLCCFCLPCDTGLVAGCNGGYAFSDIGNCDRDGHTFIESAEECTEAATVLELTLNDTVPNTDADGNDNTAGLFGNGTAEHPHGCYWQWNQSNGAPRGPDQAADSRLYFNPNGVTHDDDDDDDDDDAVTNGDLDRSDADVARFSICSKSAEMHVGCSTRLLLSVSTDSETYTTAKPFFRLFCLELKPVIQP